MLKSKLWDVILMFMQYLIHYQSDLWLYSRPIHSTMQIEKMRMGTVLF